VPVSCFLLFLCFRKATQEIFSELDETKAEPPIFPDTSQSPKMRRRGARTRPHHRAAWARPWPCHQGVSHPGPPPDTALPPIYSPRREKPKPRSIFLKTYCKTPPSSTRDRKGTEALLDTLPNEVLPRQCPCLGLLNHGAYVGAWRIRRLQTETGIHRNSPSFSPRRVKTYILLIRSCITCIVGAVTVVRR
jgi:hypothetical protein